jgi:hypothetical protein
MENINEIWKPVYLKEFEDLYEVSNKGNVRRDRRMLKPTLTKEKYHQVKLCNGKNKKTMMLHRLVKLTFDPIDNPEQYHVHHRTPDKLNNNLYNLQYLTPREHTYLEIKKGTNRIGNIGKKSLCFKGIIGKFNKEGFLLNTYEGTYDLETNGYIHSKVYKVINKNGNTHKGYMWKRFPKKHKPEIGKQYDLNDPMFDRTIKKTKKQPIVQMAFKF